MRVIKILIVALGTRGDLELFLSLASELRRRNHDVVFATSPFYADRVAGAGIECLPLGGGSREEMLSVLRSLEPIDRPALRTREYFLQWIQPQLSASVADITRAASASHYFISNLKMALRKDSGTMPGAFVIYDPPAAVADLDRYGSREHAGRIIEIVAMSRDLIDPGRAWDERFRFTGFWEPAAGAGLEPDPALAGFVDSGTPPVAFTMGSMAMFDADRFVQTVSEALRIANLRGVVVGSWSRIRAAACPHMHIVAEVSYDWLFPRAACVVHHGGCGTVAAVLCAGKPSILLPQVLCQFDFAKVLLRNRLAVAAFDVRKMSAVDLAGAIKLAVSDGPFRAAAAEWRGRICAERGVAAAADLIEAHWNAIA